ncbi:MAG: nicotinamide mononucleotide transporter [Clostridia bacterium]|nr:nicotinamide mononucleotide transporter [Clostridia bacterium]
MVMILSILGAAFSLGGNILIMLKKRMGWLMWILGNIAWIAVNIIGTFNLPMVIMYIVYFIINVAGFIKWKDKS